MSWQYVRNPVAQGATYPPIRFDATEPTRRCTRCRGTAVCTAVTRESLNFVSTGTTYTYVCPTCRAHFEILSAYGVLFFIAVGTFLNLLGALTLMVGIGVLFLLFGLGGYALAAFAVLRWLRHPTLS